MTETVKYFIFEGTYDKSLYNALSQLSISPGVFHDVFYCEPIEAGVCRLLLARL